jgi:hypothetical protein
MWLETSKMNPQLTGNLLGGGLLGDILARMTAVQQALQSGSKVSWPASCPCGLSRHFAGAVRVPIQGAESCNLGP